MERNGGAGGPRGRADWGEVARYLGHGLTLAASAALFMLAGFWLDRRLGTSPVLTVLLALLGAAAGFYSMYHQLVVSGRAREEGRRRSGDAGGREEGRRRSGESGAREEESRLSGDLSVEDGEDERQRRGD